VAASKEPVTSQSFVKVVPEFSFADAPRPDIFVIPGGMSKRLLDSPEAMEWVKRSTREAEIAMTVCTGAFVLAKTGVMAGKDVTTYHGAIAGLQRAVPEAHVEAGRRFVDNGSFLTTAGVSAGIDGSLHVVARLLGRVVADRTARYMEYAWSPEATLAGTYATLNPSTDARGRARQLADETYNLACLLARAGRIADALEALESAVKDGFGPREVLERDEDLAPLRGNPRFAALLASMDAKKPGPKS
jgi:putative intracellular protease/amidase